MKTLIVTRAPVAIVIRDGVVVVNVDKEQFGTELDNILIIEEVPSPAAVRQRHLLLV